MDKGNVLHASHNDIHVLRFIGDIRYPLSPSIDHFLEKLFAGPKPAGFVIDLTETDSIDSTNLGLLARLATRMQQLDARRVPIVSNRADINSVLTSMALDEIFDIVEDTGLETGAVQEVPQENTDREALARTLIDAHRALMDLNERNREMFRDVVASLEKNGASG
jgi:anti-anti-sigma factor